MKKNVFIMSLIAVLAFAVSANAAVTYVDATTANTTLADGAALNVTDSPTNPEDISTSGSGATANDHWHIRTGFSNNGDVFASHAESDSPILKTTVSGLTVGKLYKVYTYYWVAGDGAPTGNNQWDISTALTETELTGYLWDDGTQITDAGYFDATVLITEGNRRLFQIDLGYIAPDASGQINVFVSDFPGNDDRTWYDGVGTEPYIPSAAWNPTPENEESFVPLDTTLTWSSAMAYTIQKEVLYIRPAVQEEAGFEPNWLDTANTYTLDPAESPVDPDVDISELPWANGTKYYWRVDTYEPNTPDPNIYTGSTWSFTTIPESPVITSQPAESVPFRTLRIRENGPAVLSISAINPQFGDATGLEYQWYHKDTPVGTDSNTLSIPSVQVADGGEYYCNVTVASNGINTLSDSAWIVVERCVQHHSFDNVLTDPAGGNDGAVYDVNDLIGAKTAVYGLGYDDTPDSAILLDGQTYVSIGTAGSPSQNSDSLRYGTLACWIKTDSDGDLMGTFNDGTGLGFEAEVTGGKFRAIVRDNNNYPYAQRTSSRSVNDNQWHFVVAAWNVRAPLSGMQMTLYIDGASEGTTTFTAGSFEMNSWAYDMLIGAYNDRGVAANAFTGLIDEVKVYNYTMTPEEVAIVYEAYTGINTCLYRPTLDWTGPDGQPDCIVNLYDFVVFASSWLDCGLFPTCN